MTDTTEQRAMPTIETIFGDAAPQWRQAMDALHQFARKSDCPLGSDVIQWFAAETIRANDAMLKERDRND